MSTTGSQPPAPDPALLELQRPIPTGGTLVVFQEDAKAEDEAAMLGNLGFRAQVARRSDEIADLTTAPGDADDAVVLDALGIALIPPEDGAPSTRVAALQSSELVADVTPEFWTFEAAPPYSDTASRTWGMQATGAFNSRYTGMGVKLAVLDTGLDLTHPDFASRTVNSKSFVPNESVQDLQGHGTHCAGTAAGKAPAGVPRYGVAPDAELYVGKVLSNAGSGTNGWVLAGIAWALAAGCEVISMSLGAPVLPGAGSLPAFDRAGRRALAAGSLIIAAAGNDSRRSLGYIAAVNSPANSPDILAVAALDAHLAVADFSCGSINPGADVELAAPGVNVFSSFPMARRYRSLSGTSMACPHVAGIAALWAESNPLLRGAALRTQLLAQAKPMPLPVGDVGSGLATAP